MVQTVHGLKIQVAVMDTQNRHLIEEENAEKKSIEMEDRCAELIKSNLSIPSRGAISYFTHLFFHTLRTFKRLTVTVER